MRHQSIKHIQRLQPKAYHTEAELWAVTTTEQPQASLYHGDVKACIFSTFRLCAI